MAKLNVKTKTPAQINFTHGGAIAQKLTPEQELLRATLSTFLWEDTYYESGVDIAKRITNLINDKQVRPEFVSQLAILARGDFNLRHVPLWLTNGLLNREDGRAFVADTVEAIVQRPDEMGEILAMYWKGGKKPIANSLKKGLARAFPKFDEYALAKYNRDANVTLRDVLFLTHPKPSGRAQQAVWNRLVNGQLKTPDTWEVNLSAGKDKKETWTRMLQENKLGGLAILRNLRNMETVGVDRDLIREGIRTGNFSRVLPFRFIAAAQHAPRFEQELGDAMCRSMQQAPKLQGKTIIAVDRSGSMHGSLSDKSGMMMQEAADGLAMIARELCDNAVIYATAGNDSSRRHATVPVAARHGFALRDAMKDTRRDIGGGGIFLAQLMDYLYKEEKTADRVIVITDEQDCDTKCNPAKANAFGDRNYILNVAGYNKAIGYKHNWTTVSGFSDAALKWMVEYERCGF